MRPKIRCNGWKRKYFRFAWEVNTPICTPALHKQAGCLSLHACEYLCRRCFRASAFFLFRLYRARRCSSFRSFPSLQFASHELNWLESKSGHARHRLSQDSLGSHRLACRGLQCCWTAYTYIGVELNPSSLSSGTATPTCMQCNAFKGLFRYQIWEPKWHPKHCATL
jgi:hypothetical protein